MKNNFPWSTHSLFGLQLDSFTVSIKPWGNVLGILSVKGLTQLYLLKTSMTYNKYLTTWFLEDYDPMSNSGAYILPFNVA